MACRAVARARSGWGAHPRRQRRAASGHALGAASRQRGAAGCHRGGAAQRRGCHHGARRGGERRGAGARGDGSAARCERLRASAQSDRRHIKQNNSPPEHAPDACTRGEASVSAIGAALSCRQSPHATNPDQLAGRRRRAATSALYTAARSFRRHPMAGSDPARRPRHVSGLWRGEAVPAASLADSVRRCPPPSRAARAARGREADVAALRRCLRTPSCGPSRCCTRRQ